MKKIVILFVAVVISFLTIEMGFRIFFSPPQMVSVEINTQKSEFDSEITGQEVATRLEEGSIFIETPSGRRLRPYTNVEIKNHTLSNKTVRFYINSLGMRHSEISEVKKEYQRRILFLGDSITFNDYLNDDKTFIRMVENKLNSSEIIKKKNLEYEAINAGVGAIGLHNIYSILVENGLKTEPDIVIVGFYLNDYELSEGITMINTPGLFRRFWAMQYLYKTLSILRYQLTDRTLNPLGSREQRIIQTNIINDLKNNFHYNDDDFRTSEKGFNRLIVENAIDWGSAWSEKAWDVMEPIFMELNRLSQEHNFELIIMCFPVIYQVESEYDYNFPQDKLKNICQRNRMPYLDLLPYLRKAYQSGDKELFYDHCHLTPKGNYVVADAIYNYFVENNFLK